MIGITAIGAYLPRLRLSRQLAVDSLGRPSPDIAAGQTGMRSVCDFDEDTLTMAHEAARRCLRDTDRPSVDGAYLCSTTLPFADRQNAVIQKTALGLTDRLETADFAGSLRAGTTGLLAALSAVRSGEKKSVLVTAAEKRLAPPGSPDELFQGDGAAALLVGDTDPVAEFLGSISIARDFVDHYRRSDNAFDYRWEDRWSVDTVLLPAVKEALAGLLEKLQLQRSDIDTLVIPAPTAAVHARIRRSVSLPEERFQDPLLDAVGNTGAAHPLLLTAAALEQASPGQLIVSLGVGSGVDALCFRVRRTTANRTLSHAIETGTALESYTGFLARRGLIEIAEGIRGEIQTKTALSVLQREQDTVLSLAGGQCARCGTPQFPKSRICVNPACRAPDTQDAYDFANRNARIRTYTGDFLLPTPNPPALYGLIQFDGGGRMHTEFCDCTLDELSVGGPVRMVFRKRYDDSERGFIGYFWKATPIRNAGGLP